MKKLILFISLLISTTLFANASNDDFNEKNADFICMLNRSVSLYLFSESKSVYTKHFLKPAEEIILDQFQVYRCPYCFSFSGKLNNVIYSGQSFGEMDTSTDQEWSVVLNLKIDGVALRPIQCEVP